MLLRRNRKGNRGTEGQGRQEQEPMSMDNKTVVDMTEWQLAMQTK